MTRDQYLAAIAKLGLTQERAGEFWGWAPRTGQRIAAGEKDVPACVVYLIKLMLRHKVQPGNLNKKFR